MLWFNMYYTITLIDTHWVNNSNFARYHKSSLPFVQVCLANDVMKTHIVNYGSKITYLYLSLLYLRLFYGITFYRNPPMQGKELSEV